MANAVFKGSTEEECVKDACASLNIDTQNLVYTVIEEKKTLFWKNVSISVVLPESNEFNENNGTIKIVNGNIIIKNPKENGEAAKIKIHPDIKIKVNGEDVQESHYVYENSDINIVFPETNAYRKMDIKINEDRTEAYLSITYEAKNLYKLKDKEESHNVSLEAEIKEEIWPPFYSVEEIKNEISKRGIVFGLIEENIQKCAEEKNSQNILIAQGIKCIDNEDDKIIIKFETDKGVENLAMDNKGKIDFKSIGSISAAYKDQILAVRIPGKVGQDGKDVFGKEMKHKAGKTQKLKAADGCTLKDENTVVALKEGKPCIKNNVFYVYEIHEVLQNVDLSTGNIKFIGDVIIHGTVKEGMKVEAGNSIRIDNNVEQAEVMGKGNIEIKGNVIASTVVAGGEDVHILRHLEIITTLMSLIKELINTVEEVKKFNLLGYDTSDGKIIKLLIEQKFKKIPVICLNYITICTMEKSNDELKDEFADNIISLLKEKLIGLGPLSIRNYGELDDIVSIMHEEIEYLKANLSLPVNIKMNYCQDSTVNSSGDIVITGDGVYVSNITAFNAIYFTGEKSVVRGGCLKADNEIKCKIVGTLSGVETSIQVGEKGHIYSDIAYQNTKFYIGNREYTLEVPGKNIHAYNNENNELMVDMLKLDI